MRRSRRCLSGSSGVGLGPGSGDGEQGRGIAVTAQSGAQIAEGPETVAEAFGGRRGIEPLEEVDPEGFLLNLGPGGRMAEEFGEIVHGNPCCLVTLTTM